MQISHDWLTFCKTYTVVHEGDDGRVVEEDEFVEAAVGICLDWFPDGWSPVQLLWVLNYQSTTQNHEHIK